MRKRRVALFSADSLKQLAAAATLAGALWQGWQAGHKAENADARAGAVAAYAVNVAGQRDSLAVRVGNLERAVRRLRVKAVQTGGAVVVYGPEVAPEGYRPQSHGLLWRLTHPMGGN